MNKLSYEVMDVTELENVMGGSEIKYVGCVITNGKCSTDGGCGICNGKCNGSIDQGSTDSKPIEKNDSIGSCSIREISRNQRPTFALTSLYFKFCSAAELDTFIIIEYI